MTNVKDQSQKKVGTTSKESQIISGLRLLQKRIEVEELDTFSLRFNVFMEIYRMIKKNYAVWVTPLFMFINSILVILYAVENEGLLIIFCWISIFLSLVYGNVVMARETKLQGRGKQKTRRTSSRYLFQIFYREERISVKYLKEP
jgi:hypothetical protein